MAKQSHAPKSAPNSTPRLTSYDRLEAWLTSGENQKLAKFVPPNAHLNPDIGYRATRLLRILNVYLRKKTRQEALANEGKAEINSAIIFRWVSTTPIPKMAAELLRMCRYYQQVPPEDLTIIFELLLHLNDKEEQILHRFRAVLSVEVQIVMETGKAASPSEIAKRLQHDVTLWPVGSDILKITDRIREVRNGSNYAGQVEVALSTVKSLELSSLPRPKRPRFDENLKEIPSEPNSDPDCASS